MRDEPVGFTRRDFVRTGTSAAAALTVGGWQAPAWSAMPKKWGLQLYTLRTLMRDKPGETLAAAAAIGYREIEVLQQSLDHDMPFVKAAGLEAPSMHMPASVVMGEGTVAKPAEASGAPPKARYDIEAAIGDAKRHGIRHVVVAFIPPENRTLEVLPPLPRCDEPRGRKVPGGGPRPRIPQPRLRVRDRRGSRTHELLPRALRSRAGDAGDGRVRWSLAGRDPAKDIKELGKKVSLLHLKDRAKGTEDAAPGKTVPATAFAEVGSGTLDFKAILAAASDAGIEHTFVEQDQTPGDPLESIKKSYAYLSGLRV